VSGTPNELDVQPIHAASVVSLAYDRIRALILSGDVAPGTRLGQVDLAERLGVSRTPVREALRRLTGEGLVEFQDQRGFRVADIAIDDVVRRLEVRLLLEPGAARLAAERATEEDLELLAAAIERERRARSAVAAHDASREFHLLIAAATHNRELVGAIEALWLIEVGRRLLARRRAAPAWQAHDVEEHEAILAALRKRDAALAGRLMDEHVRDALRHWEAA
jgi:DNA-binding GntR family transcriptional regulator